MDSLVFKFYPRFECQYNPTSLLIYGAFSGDRPSWHYVRNKENWHLDELIPVRKEEDDINKVYRVRGREGNKTRFTYQKIRRLAKDWSGEQYIMAFSEANVPS